MQPLIGFLNLVLGFFVQVVVAILGFFITIAQIIIGFIQSLAGIFGL